MVKNRYDYTTFGDGCLSTDPKKLIREYKGKLNRSQAKELAPDKTYTKM